MDDLVYRSMYSQSGSLPEGATSILVVDDEPHIREFMQALLEDEGYQVDIAPNAHEALKIARTSSPDLVLSDISMPGATGVELYTWLMKEELTPRMMFMSAVTPRTPLPSVPFIEKPFDIDDLLEKVSGELAMESEQFPSPASD